VAERATGVEVTKVALTRPHEGSSSGLAPAEPGRQMRGVILRIAYHRWSHVLATGLLLAGCKSDKDTEPASKAQATAPAPRPAASASASTQAAASDATLSYMEASPDGKKCS
jgi:hypothetical protein